jgi:hypothetical protein
MRHPLILAGPTPATGLVIACTASASGGLAGMILTGLTGAPCVVEVSANGAAWQPVTYPHVLALGFLRLTRTDTSGSATVLSGTMNATATSDAEGYHSVDAVGPFPTKQLHQILQTRVGVLEVSRGAVTDPGRPLGDTGWAFTANLSANPGQFVFNGTGGSQSNNQLLFIPPEDGSSNAMLKDAVYSAGQGNGIDVQYEVVNHFQEGDGWAGITLIDGNDEQFGWTGRSFHINGDTSSFPVSALPIPVGSTTRVRLDYTHTRLQVIRSDGLSVEADLSAYPWLALNSTLRMRMEANRSIYMSADPPIATFAVTKLQASPSPVTDTPLVLSQSVNLTDDVPLVMSAVNDLAYNRWGLLVANNAAPRLVYRNSVGTLYYAPALSTVP